MRYPGFKVCFPNAQFVPLRVGEWEEPFAGKSELFGQEPGKVLRHTSYEEHPQWGHVHLTESVTPLGWETTQRHLEDGGDVMILERTYTPKMEDGSVGRCKFNSVVP
jgi:hypothetical protein